MTDEQQKEQFSIAYVRAVAAAAGVNVYRPEVDDDSVDIGFAARVVRDTVLRPRLEAQLKCSATVAADAAHYHFPLKRKNYDDLRGDDMVPRILILLVVPQQVGDWLHQTGEQMLLRRCAHWLDLRGQPENDNTTTITVAIPRSQVFDVATLRHFLSMGAPL